MTRHVLVVDDSVDDVELMLRALQDFVTAQVQVVRDGAEALEYLRRERRYAARTGGAPDVVVLDLKLPKVSGLEVLEAIRATPDTARTPVVVLTSSRQDSDVSRSYALGANAYVVKPVKYSEFTVAVKRLAEFWAEVNEPPGHL